MNKFQALKVVNPLVAVVFLVLAGTGIFRELIPDEIYRIVHPYAGYLFVTLIAVHLYLNWGWIKTTILKRS
jgi:hypothetical protein